MKFCIKHILILTTSVLLISSAKGQETKRVSPFKFLIAGALELGGDEIAEVSFTNGNTQSVKAGQGGTIALGAQYQFKNLEKLLLRGTVGYKYVTTEADNAHIRLTRIPLQLTANWMATKKLRLGAGFVTHQNIKFNADGIGQNVKFDPASGPTFEISYSGIGLSYTAMKYNNQFGRNYSANAVGLSFSFVIPR